MYSIVIPAYNSAASLIRLTACLESQTFSKSLFECIIIDDGSTDNTTEFLTGYKSELTLHVLPHGANYGRAVSRDDGWKAAKGKYVVFLDADMLPDTAWLEEFDKVLSQGSYDVVSGGIRNHAIFEILESEVEVEWPYKAFASNLAIRRSLLERVDGFNTFFPRFEDIELNLRLWEAGACYAHAPLAVAKHASKSDCDPHSLWFSAEDVSRLFIRHPYRKVLSVAAWGKMLLAGDTSHHIDGANEDGKLLQTFLDAYGEAPPIECRYTADEVKGAAIKRKHCTPDNADAELERGLADGLYTEVRDGQRLFDMEHSINWFAACSSARVPKYLDDWGIHLCTPYHTSLDPKDSLGFHCQGTYEITLPADTLEKYTLGVKINIPLPIEHESQRNVVIAPCDPPSSLIRIDAQQGMIMRHVVTASEDGLIKIAYNFEYDIYEHVPGDRPSAKDIKEDISEAYLRHGLPDASLAKACSILKRVIPDDTVDTHYKVRALYIWVWDNFEFIEFPLPPFELLNTGFGGCISRAKLFVSLLRLAGIPGREQSGVYYYDGNYTGPSMTYVQQTTGSTPFMHTWPEFYDPSRGWTPISEFDPQVRINSVAALNIDDRQRLLQGGRRRCRALFGSLEPFRTYGSEQANRLPTYPIVKTKDGWFADPNLTAATVHTVRCSMNQI